jgi:hypothetical protein
MAQNEPYRGGIGKGDAQGAGILADLNGVQPNRWVGGAAGNVNRWLTAANWSRGVIPDSTENVWIPLRPNQPLISSAVAGTVLQWNRRVLIDNNATVTLDSGPLVRLDAVGSLETNGLGRLVLEPGARLRNLGETKPLLEVRQRLTGSKGWRLLSSPVGTTFGDWLDSLETSGYPGSAYPALQPNVLWFAETDTGTTNQNWRLPPSANDTVVPGRGYFAYVFGGAARPSGAPAGNFGDTLPLVLTAIGRDNGPVGAGSFVFGTTFTPRSLSTAADTVGGNRFFLDEGVADEGWNLLGNPTAGTLNWDIPGAWSKGNIHNTIYIWDPNFGNGSGGYRYWNGALGNIDTSLGSGLLAPYQAFWVHASGSNPVLSFNTAAFSESPSTMVGRTGSTEPPPHVRVQIDGEDMQATAFVSFGPDGIFGPDLNDAYQLESYSDRWLMLYSQSSPQHQKPLVINHLPDNLLEETAIPLQVSAAGEGVSNSARYRLSWTLSENWPSHCHAIGRIVRLCLRIQCFDCDGWRRRCGLLQDAPRGIASFGFVFACFAKCPRSSATLYRGGFAISREWTGGLPPGSSAPLPSEPQPFCGGNVPILLFAPSRACDLGGFGPLGSAGGPRIVRSVPSRDPAAFVGCA